MCNINVLIRKNGTSKITAFLMAASSNSFVHNSHGEGIFIGSTEKVIKSKLKLDYNLYASKINNSKIIITHQRFSTSGFEVDYNHPFENEDFVIVHNGIINQFKKEIGSDTFGFFNEFTKEFINLNYKSRKKAIVEIINKLFSDDIGSYSIFIYDKKTQDSYYFKNSPAINFYTNPDYLFITTNNNNNVFLPMISDKEFKEINIEPRKIYRISKNGEVYFVKDMPKVNVIKNLSSWKVDNNKKIISENINNYFDYDNLILDFQNKKNTCSECDMILQGGYHKLGQDKVCYKCYNKFFGLTTKETN